MCRAMRIRLLTITQFRLLRSFQWQCMLVRRHWLAARCWLRICVIKFWPRGCAPINLGDVPQITCQSIVRIRPRTRSMHAIPPAHRLGALEPLGAAAAASKYRTAGRTAHVHVKAIKLTAQVTRNYLSRSYSAALGLTHQLRAFGGYRIVAW